MNIQLGIPPHLTSVASHALVYVDLDKNFAIQQSKKREMITLAVLQFCKSMLVAYSVSCADVLILTTCISNYFVAIATGQGSKKPVVLEQKKAYNICECFTTQSACAITW